MSDEILALQLAAASDCRRSDWSRQGKQWCTTHGGDWPLCKAAALLPVVRKAQAEELRAAAEAITENGRPDLTTVDQVNAVNEAAQWLDARADAVDEERR